MTFKIEQKFILGVVATIFLIGAIGYVVHRNLAKIDRRLEFVEAADDLNNTVLEMRRSEENYFLYHDEKSLNKVLDYVKKIDASVRAMEPEITRGMGGSSFRAFMEHLQAYKNSMANMVNNHFSSKQSMELIRDEGRELYNFTKNVSQKQRRKIAALMGLSRKILFWTVWFLLGSGLAGAHFISRGIVRPLKRIEERTQKIMEGDFTPLPEVKTHDEIQSLTQAFNQMIKQLKPREDRLIQSKKFASLGIFLSCVAHELRNPISNISTSSQILLEEIQDPDLDYKKELLGQIQQQCDRSRNIIRSFLEYSRPREPQKESLNVKSLMEETIRFIGGQIPNRVEVVLDIPDETKIYADKHRIQQAFLNFITNAVDAIPEEGVVTIRARANQEKGTVDIELHDTGTGIEPHVLPKILDPFFSTKAVGKGTGMGLFITHQIIEQHDGHITVESVVGKGTTFLLQLPLG